MNQDAPFSDVCKDFQIWNFFFLHFLTIFLFILHVGGLISYEAKFLRGKLQAH